MERINFGFQGNKEQVKIFNIGLASTKMKSNRHIDHFKLSLNNKMIYNNLIIFEQVFSKNFKTFLLFKHKILTTIWYQTIQNTLVIKFVN